MSVLTRVKTILGGSYAAVGKALGGISGEAIRKWERHGVPAERVLAIEAATGHRVSRHDLRPDIYPREPWCRCPACELERRDAEKGEEAA